MSTRCWMCASQALNLVAIAKSCDVSSWSSPSRCKSSIWLICSLVKQLRNKPNFNLSKPNSNWPITHPIKTIRPKPLDKEPSTQLGDLIERATAYDPTHTQERNCTEFHDQVWGFASSSPSFGCFLISTSSLSSSKTWLYLLVQGLTVWVKD